MRTLGLIGGTTWFSTAEYYKIINQEINRRLGGHNSAKLFLYSVNFQEYQPPSDPGGWDQVGERLSDIALRLQQSGADCIVICANTLHIAADRIKQRLRIPLIHIAEETAKAISSQNIEKVGLLGTKATMEQSFFKDCLSQSGVSALIPDKEERDFIHTSIYTELGAGILKRETRIKYLDIIQRLQKEGARGIVFGCTEIPLLLKQEDCPVPVFDTLLIHAHAAVEFALSV